MDGTILRGISFSWVVLWELCGDAGRRWRSCLTRHNKGLLSYEAWCKEAVEFFQDARLTKDLIYEAARASVAVTVNFQEGMKMLRQAGFATVLISGGVDTFLHAMIPDFESYFDEVHINKLQFDTNGIVSGVISTEADFRGKAVALEAACLKFGADRAECIFVGDRFNDRHAIKFAGHSVIYSDAKDGVEYGADHTIVVDDFAALTEYILSISQV